MRQRNIFVLEQKDLSVSHIEILAALPFMHFLQPGLGSFKSMGRSMQYLSNMDIFPHNAPLFSLLRIQMKKYPISQNSRKKVHGQRKSACVVQEEHSASPQAKTLMIL